MSNLSGAKGKKKIVEMLNPFELEVEKESTVIEGSGDSNIAVLHCPFQQEMVTIAGACRSTLARRE